MKNKNVKIILSIFILYFVVMLILFLPNYLRNKYDNLYILSGNFVKIKYENGTWSNISDSKDYKLKEFTVYDDNEYKGVYKLLFSNRFYLYDFSSKAVDYTGPLFAYNGTLKLNVIGIDHNNEMSESDIYIIQNVLASLDISYTDNFNLFQKVDLDLDNDGGLETIYCINNYYVDNISDKVFSIIFLHKNNTNTILASKVISMDQIYDEPSFEIHKILDIRNDKKYEILFTQNYFGQPEKECAILYELSGKRKEIANFCD